MIGSRCLAVFWLPISKRATQTRTREPNPLRFSRRWWRRPLASPWKTGSF